MWTDAATGTPHSRTDWSWVRLQRKRARAYRTARRVTRDPTSSPEVEADFHSVPRGGPGGGSWGLSGASTVATKRSSRAENTGWARGAPGGNRAPLVCPLDSGLQGYVEGGCCPDRRRHPAWLNPSAACTAVLPRHLAALPFASSEKASGPRSDACIPVGLGASGSPSVLQLGVCLPGTVPPGRDSRVDRHPTSVKGRRVGGKKSGV